MFPLSRHLDRALVSLAIGTGAGCSVCALGLSLALVSGEWVPVNQVPHIVRLGHPADVAPVGLPSGEPLHDHLPGRPLKAPGAAPRLVVINDVAAPDAVHPAVRSLLALVNMGSEVHP